MNAENKEKLRIFMEKEYHLFGDPEYLLHQAIIAIDWLKEDMKRIAPHEIQEIENLQGVYNWLRTLEAEKS